MQCFWNKCKASKFQHRKKSAFNAMFTALLHWYMRSDNGKFRVIFTYVSYLWVWSHLQSTDRFTMSSLQLKLLGWQLQANHKRFVSFFCKSTPLDTSDAEPSNLCNIILDTHGRNHWMRVGLTIGVTFFQRLVLFQQIGPSEVGQFHRVSRCLSWKKKPTLKLAIVSTYTFAVGEWRKELHHQSKLKIGPIIAIKCDQTGGWVDRPPHRHPTIPKFKSMSRD